MLNRGFELRNNAMADKHRTNAMDGSAISALVDETQAPPDAVKSSYEEEVAVLSAEAKVTNFIAVIAKQRVKRRLKRQH